MKPALRQRGLAPLDFQVRQQDRGPRDAALVAARRKGGTARATLLAMGFRSICEARPAGAPQRRFIVAVR